MAQAVAHLNIIGFRAAVAALEDPFLRGRPYVIAASSGGRALAWDVSPEGIRQNIQPGMPLAAAQALVKDLILVAPNPAACHRANEVLEKVIDRYAPAWQNDGAGNIFLDITGTQGLFGPPADCVCRVQHEILDRLRIRAALATATNKLVTKVASRAIRPAGLIEVRPGDEASFLSRQNISLLPGMGRGLLRTAAATGIKEIGEVALLSPREAAALFGKGGPSLRINALGIDSSPVEGGERRIWSRRDLPEDIIEGPLIRAALASLVSEGGLRMRNEKLGARQLSLAVVYGDGLEVRSSARAREPLVLDRDIFAAAEALYAKTVERRIRIRSLGLGLETLGPLCYQPDLFEVQDPREALLQRAADSIQGRYGAGALRRAMALEAPAESGA